MIIDVITHPIFLWSVGITVAAGIFIWILSYFVASYFVYTKTLRKNTADQWSRELPTDIEDDSKRMYEMGRAWSEENIAYKTDVHIVNKGLNLYGEYYDFGKKRCAMILSGRTECLKYGYFFAIPYAQNDCNVLVIDPRAHGLSDGKFNTVGFEESGDAIAWVKFLQQNFGVEHIIFHGICIGAATGMLALSNEECPKIIDGIVTEGMFPNFCESVKNHMIERKRPVFIMGDLVDAWMKHYTGHSMKFGPIDVIDKIELPLLMLHSKEDLYSTPFYAQKLFEKSGSKNKRLVWFEKGKHSMLRITDTPLYDNSIAEFLNEVYKNTPEKEKSYTV